MNLRRSVAIALTLLTSSTTAVSVWGGGWYLMQAPSEADLDTSCRADGSPTWRDYLVAAFRNSAGSNAGFWESSSRAQAMRCVREMFACVPEASISQWIQIDVEKDLDECKAIAISGGDAMSKPFPGLIQDVVGKQSAGTSDRGLDDFVTTLDKDPAFKKHSEEWDQATRDKCRRLLESSRYADDPVRMLVGLSMCDGLTGSWDVGKEHRQCVASDDPRLRGN
jgi:hypothetical protein